MEQIGRYVAWAGVAIAAVGAVIWGLGKVGFRGLPGDIRYQSDGVRIYFPVVTSIVVSLVLTALLWLWNWLRRG